MQKNILIALVGIVVVGAGIAYFANSGTTQTSPIATEEHGTMASSSEEAIIGHAGSYVPYSSDKIALAAKGPVILFFHASWCPTCIGLDKDIKAHLNDIPEHVTILDVDYDSSQALKVKYGVTIQHTLVQVDASGNLIKTWQGSPTLADLLTQVKK